MPIHDWSRIPSGLFQDFHQTWSIQIKVALNNGILPKGVSALVEQQSGPKEFDVLAVSRANRISVKHHLGKTIAIIEIISPGNKDTKAAVRDFLDKTFEFLRAGVHVLLIDLFPPSPRDPLGIHQLIWDEIGNDPFAFPPGKDRILASYEASEEKVAYVQPVAVGDVPPDMPLFLSQGLHVKVPLESTYQSAWAACPQEMQVAVETGVMPEPDPELDD